MAAACSTAYLAGVAAALGIDPNRARIPASPYIVALAPAAVVAVLVGMDAAFRPARGLVARMTSGILRLASAYGDRAEWHLRIAVAVGAVVVVQVGCELASLR